MRILFCKISNMKYYKGVSDKDPASFGGKFVDENGYGHEELNFYPMLMDEADREECLGFVEPKSNRNVRNTLHIEKIEGLSAFKDEPSVDDVLVIWCATRERGDVTVVGWYKHATVYRDLQEWTLVYDDNSEDERYYNVRAFAENCTLLPSSERNRHIWQVPTAKYTKSYGFGQSMVWYPTAPEAEIFLQRLVENIENYKGENHLYVGAE